MWSNSNLRTVQKCDMKIWRIVPWKGWFHVSELLHSVGIWLRAHVRVE